MSEMPVSVQTVLNEYIALLHERLPNTLEGLYLQGSIALNAYVNGLSDIDFITVINRRLSEGEMRVLSEIHKTIASKHQSPEMDGTYMMWKDIGKLEAEDDNYPYYNEGTLGYGAYFNPITWWILKTNGISIIGPEPSALKFEIDSQHVVSYVIENMNTYWAGRVQRIENAMGNKLYPSTAEIDGEIEWSVLGLLRQYYTLKEHDIISKLGAGEYALLHMPMEWHPIIKEAINIRKGMKIKIFTSDKERINMTLQFLKYIIQHCNSDLVHEISPKFT